MVDVCVSAAAVSASTAQLLDAFASGGIMPVQVFVTVWPIVEGTVTLLVGGIDAKLNMPSRTATEQRLNANKMRGLKRPDFELRLSFIGDLPHVGLQMGWFDSRSGRPNGIYLHIRSNSRLVAVKIACGCIFLQSGGFQKSAPVIPVIYTAPDFATRLLYSDKLRK
jgi:hypothetical protein